MAARCSLNCTASDLVSSVSFVRLVGHMRLRLGMQKHAGVGYIRDYDAQCGWPRYRDWDPAFGRGTALREVYRGSGVVECAAFSRIGHTTRLAVRFQFMNRPFSFVVRSAGRPVAGWDLENEVLSKKKIPSILMAGGAMVGILGLDQANSGYYTDQLFPCRFRCRAHVGGITVQGPEPAHSIKS